MECVANRVWFKVGALRLRTGLTASGRLEWRAVPLGFDARSSLARSHRDCISCHRSITLDQRFQTIVTLERRVAFLMTVPASGDCTDLKIVIRDPGCWLRESV